MKNIHVLPTKLASEYYITKEGKLGESYSLKRGGAVHFYITNDEKIKEGDWFLNDMNILFKADKNYIENPAKEVYIGHKKIILTTDQDLIKDGVQAIDDEFLEWFVKNPSCEEVEVNEMCYGALNGFSDAGYKIIIPKEELPKSELKIGDNTNFGIITDIKEKSVCFGKNKLGVDVWYKKSDVKKEPKQETLEEAAEKYATNHGMMAYVFPEKKESFIQGAKWQQEQDKNKYSEEEVVKLLIKFNQEIQEVENVREWFEEFKKK